VNTRALTTAEAEQLRKLNESGLDSALLFLTETGLHKSILDATGPVRDFLRKAGIHDYESQKQGEQHKVRPDGIIYQRGQPNKIKISLYRPKTKKGDPRIWPYRLGQFAKPNDVIALFSMNQKIHIVNLSEYEPVKLDDASSELSDLLNSSRRDHNQVAAELLSKLERIAGQGPIPADGHGDTAVGRSVETALGIRMNPDKAPDYKGIELKAHRTGANTRVNLFAQVANWRISKIQSSRKILESFGYDDAENQCRRLCCTVSTKAPNPQGLILVTNFEKGRLDENCHNGNRSEPVCTWEMRNLHNRLLEKHAETFWISAREINNDGRVYFKLESILHTRRPSTQQFDRLLDSGIITMDHLIKMKDGKCVEKGPLFKIYPKMRGQLFLGEPSIHKL
jgi:hypothetical protein